MFQVVASTTNRLSEWGTATRQVPVFFLECRKEDAFAKARDILRGNDEVCLSIMDTLTWEMLEESE